MSANVPKDLQESTAGAVSVSLIEEFCFNESIEVNCSFLIVLTLSTLPIITITIVIVFNPDKTARCFQLYIFTNEILFQ